MHNEVHVEADVSRLPMHFQERSSKALKKSPNNQLLVGALAHFIFVFLKCTNKGPMKEKEAIQAPHISFC